MLDLIVLDVWQKQGLAQKSQSEFFAFSELFCHISLLQ